MRNHPWRLLLLRCRSANMQLHIPRHFSSSTLHPTPRRHFSSLLHSRARIASQFSELKNPSFRCFSTSELAISDKDSDHAVLLTDIFSKPNRTSDEIKDELGSSGVVITNELVLKVLQSPSTSPEVARSLFDWVSENAGERLSSHCYNWMLGILGSNGNVKAFWDLVGIMKKKGYGVSKGAHARALEKFEKEGLGNDVEELNRLYASGSIDNSPDKVCSKVCKVIRREVWGDEVEKTLLDLKIAFSSDLVVSILGNLGSEPNKALIFFRWIQESNLLKHDERTYNAMAKVLAREDCIDKFWRVVDEMKGWGFELERTSYVEVSERFTKRKMIKDAVDLYLYAMAGANKPSVHDSTFLLKKVVVSKELDMDLFLQIGERGRGAGHALDLLVRHYCRVHRAVDAVKFLNIMVSEKELKPQHSTFKVLISQLLVQGGFEEALNLLRLMKNQGFPPFIVPFVEYVSRTGTVDEAMMFLNAMTVKRFPSTNVFLRLFEAYFKAKRQSEAQDLLSICPGFIRNHADVLNLFFTKSPQAAAKPRATTKPQAASTDTLVAA